MSDDPIRTITDGRLVIGEIYEAEEGFRATGPDEQPLGTWPTLDRARSAVMEHRLAMRTMCEGRASR